MSKFREKAEAQTEQIIGQMLGDELLVREGQERSRKAAVESAPPDDQRATVEHQGAGNQVGKRNLQRERGIPDTPRRGAEGQGIVRDERGQEQPKDKARAQQVSRVDKGGDPPGKRA
jgi:hypothetical protein